MPRSRPFLIPAVLSCLALAGCGADAGRPAAAVPSPAGSDAATVSTTAAITEGRTGDAVTGASGGKLRELSSGGRPDPSERPRAGRRDGVGAGEACQDPELAPSAESISQVEAVTLCLLNGERADRGLPALRADPKLARAALGHAQDMVAHSYFAHEGRDGSDIEKRIGATGYIPTDRRWTIGENLAWGTGALATPKSIVNAWMNSEGHRANILQADYRDIGFGIAPGNPKALNGFGATYATEFGAVDEPRAASAQRTTAPAPAAPTRSQATRPVSSSRRVLGRRKASTCAKVARAASKRARASSPAATRTRRACAARAKSARAKAARAKRARA